MTMIPSWDLFSLNADLDHAEFEGVSGVYVLHFDSTVRYATPGREPGTPGAYGDYEHYVGQSDNVGRRFRHHRTGWSRSKAGLSSSKGSAFVRVAGRQGVPFRLAFVHAEADASARIEVEREITRRPPAHCPICQAAGCITPNG